MKSLALVGCGDVAFRTYIPGILAIADRGTVTATFDPIAERAERAAAMFPNATAYTSYEAMLAHPGLDGIFNLTPAPFHRDTTTRALDAGLHVFSEKPLASTIADGQALIDHADRLGKLLLCAPAVMATGRFRWVKQFLDTGGLAQPHLATAQMANMGPAAWNDYTGDPAVFYSKDVGPMLDTGVYVLHAITGLLGPAKRVQAFGGIAIPHRTITIPRLSGQTITVGANDVMLIHLDFGHNRFAQILSTFAVPATRAPALEIHSANGTLSFTQDWYDAWAKVDLYRAGQAMEEVGPSGRPEGADGHLIGAGPAHFVACLEGEEQPILTAAHALHVLDIMLAATRSASEGCAVEVGTGF